MKQTLKLSDITALGFMLFAFFLGAGNIIFPPLTGLHAGENFVPAMIGFLITAVGLPLMSIIAIAVAGGTWEHLSKDLPKQAATLMAVLMFIVIGPAFAAPRTGLVAYEIALKPLLNAPDKLELALFSVVFFSIAVYFAWAPGKLVDVIGKVLTPVLFIGLIILAVAVFIMPQGTPLAAQGEYMTQPLTKGFLEGYNTMDTFGALMFGMLMVDALKSKGITEAKSKTNYLIKAALIAATGLALVYISLLYLGATSSSIAAGVDNGGTLLSLYVQALFGSYGQAVLSTIVLLACLTTAIGLISACSDYFSNLTPFSYRTWVMTIGVISAIVANVGLSQLIALSVPVLHALYPVAIALVVLTFLRRFMPNPVFVYRAVLVVSLLFSLLDAAKSCGLDVSAFAQLPLFSIGMGWLLPTLATLVVTLVVSKLVDVVRPQKSSNQA